MKRAFAKSVWLVVVAAMAAVGASIVGWGGYVLACVTKEAFATDDVSLWALAVIVWLPIAGPILIEAAIWSNKHRKP